MNQDKFITFLKRILVFVALVIAAFSVTGCETLGRYASNPAVRKALQNAVKCFLSHTFCAADFYRASAAA
jgi:hypothetical protein